MKDENPLKTKLIGRILDFHWSNQNQNDVISFASWIENLIKEHQELLNKENEHESTK